MIALVNSGQCYGVGYNKSGAVGIGEAPYCSTFTLIPGLIDICFVSAGQNISMFIDKTKKLYSCGVAALHGNVDINNQMTPKIVSTFAEKPIIYVSCGFVHCAAIDGEGKLYTWGSNKFYQLGHGDEVRMMCNFCIEKSKTT